MKDVEKMKNIRDRKDVAEMTVNGGMISESKRRVEAEQLHG